VTVLDNFSTADKANLADVTVHPKLEIVLGDITNGALMRDLFENTGAAVVVHLAARNASTSVADPSEVIRTNVRGTETILNEVVLASSLPTVVFASSATIYGNPIYTPIDEKHPLNPQTVYAKTKVECEGLMTEVAQNGIRAVSLRLFNVYGPGQIGKHGAVVPRFTEAISSDRAITLDGGGDQKRSFIYVSDVADAFLLAAVKTEVHGHEIYNIGSPHVYTVKELAEEIATLLARDLKVTNAPRRDRDVPVSYPDISKAMQELGFNPAVSLEEGLRKTIAWIQNQSD